MVSLPETPLPTPHGPHPCPALQQRAATQLEAGMELHLYSDSPNIPYIAEVVRMGLLGTYLVPNKAELQRYLVRAPGWLARKLPRLLLRKWTATQ